MSFARSERPEPQERSLNIPEKPPTARSLGDTPRGWGTITVVPTDKNSCGQVRLEEEPTVLVHIPMNIIELAHHRDSFKLGARADISHRRERSGQVAVRINQIMKAKKSA